MMVSGNYLSILKLYYALHTEANYNNGDIDEMTMFEAEFYLIETMERKEKEAEQRKQLMR